MNLPAMRLNEPFYVSLKRGLGVPATLGECPVDGLHAVLCVSQVCAKVCDPNGAGASQIDLLGSNGRKNDGFFSGTSDGDIEPPLTTGPIERAEIHRHLTGAVGPISDTEQHHVALVTLHVLQIFDKGVVFGFRTELSL